jgi:hypothetical protein
MVRAAGTPFTFKAFDIPALTNRIYGVALTRSLAPLNTSKVAMEKNKPLC